MPNELKTAYPFPGKAVFLDNDPIRAAHLKAQGFLCYQTLLQAVASWRSGGEAFVAFGGAPTAASRGVILGNGSFSDNTANTLDVQFLDIASATGNPFDFEITGSSGSYLWDITVDNVRFYNFRCCNAGSGTASCMFRANGNKANVVWSGLVHSNSTNTQQIFILTDSTGLSGLITGCELTAQNGSNANIWTLEGASDYTLKDSLLVSINGALINGGGSISGLWKNNRLQIQSDMALINLTGANSLNMDGFYVEQSTGSYFFATGGTVTGTLRNIYANLKQGLIGPSASFGGIMEHCYIVATTGNNPAVVTAAGARYRHNTLIGNGSGRAISGAVTIQATNNSVRNTTGDVAASWTNATLAGPLAAVAYNAELNAATTS